MSVAQPVPAAFYVPTSFYDVKIATTTTTAIAAATNTGGVIICGGSILAWNESGGGFRNAHNSILIPCLKIQAGVKIDFEYTNELAGNGSLYMTALFLRANSQRILACGQSTTNADFVAVTGQAIPSHYQVTFGYKLL